MAPVCPFWTAHRGHPVSLVFLYLRLCHDFGFELFACRLSSLSLYRHLCGAYAVPASLRPS